MTDELDPGDAGVVQHGHRGHVHDGEHHGQDLHAEQATRNHQLGSRGHKSENIYAWVKKLYS